MRDEAEEVFGLLEHGWRRSANRSTSAAPTSASSVLPMAIVIDAATWPVAVEVDEERAGQHRGPDRPTEDDHRRERESARRPHRRGRAREAADGQTELAQPEVARRTRRRGRLDYATTVDT